MSEKSPHDAGSAIAPAYRLLPRHLRIFRWICLLVVVPVALIAAGMTALLWQLARGPADITRLSRFLGPIPIVAGREAGHPAGQLTWGHLFLQWQPARGATPSGLMLEAHDLSVRGLDGRIVERAGEVDTVLALAPLFRGVIAPRRLRLQHVKLALRAATKDGLVFDLPQQGRQGRGATVRLERLTLLDIQDVTVTIAGLAPHDVLTIGPIEAHGLCAIADRSGHCAWAGALQSVVSLGTFHTRFQAEGHAEGTFGAWHFAIPPVVPAALASVVPSAAPWNVPASLEGDVRLLSRGFDLGLSSLSFDVGLGAGQIRQGPGAHRLTGPTGPATLHVRNGIIRGQMMMAAPGLSGPVHVQVPAIALHFVDSAGTSTHFQASGSLVVGDIRDPRSIDGEAAASVDTLNFAWLDMLWPSGFIKGARAWVVNNITSGQGHALNVMTRFHSDSGPDNIRPTRMEAHFQAEGLTVHWLRPIPPAVGVAASLHFDGPETLVVDFAHARQETGAGTLMVPKGTMRIGRLYDHGSPAVLDLHLGGPLAALHEVLIHPRLRLLSRHPLPFTRYAGVVEGHLNLAFPLAPLIRQDDMHLRVQAAFHDVHLEHVLFDRALDGAAGTLTADDDALVLNGAGMLSAIPVQVVLRENLRSGSAHNRSAPEEITGRATLTPTTVRQAGFDTDGMLTGEATLKAHYVRYLDHQADLVLSLDLQAAGLHLPLWSKLIGENAEMRGHLKFSDDRVTLLDGLTLQGPGLTLSGHGLTRNDTVRGIVVDHVRMGRSVCRGQIDFPDEPGLPVTVHVLADPLDMAPFLHDRRMSDRHVSGERVARTAPQAAGQGVPWSILLDAPQVYYSAQGVLGHVTAQTEWRAGQLRSARFAMDQPSRVRGVLADSGVKQPLVLDIDDLGALLKGLGVYSRINGGVVHLDGEFIRHEDMATGTAGIGLGLPPFWGHVVMGTFDIQKPPLSMTVASDLSPLHWSSTHASRFTIQRLSSDMTLANGQIDLTDGAIGNQALGATVEGQIGLDDTSLALNGTIVPLFGLNALPGRLPGVGRLLAPERGGGVLSATFRVGGTVTEPRLTINPLSMLLPGVLRKIVR